MLRLRMAKTTTSRKMQSAMNKTHLHPFFSYFGSKYRLAKHYPVPEYDEIIEPFAGSAGYALLYPDKQVTLYEVSEPIVKLWKWLTTVSEDEVLALPTNEKDGPPRFHKDHPAESEVSSEPALILMGLWLTESQTIHSRYPLSLSRGGNWTRRKKEMIASQLKHIRHWKVEHKSFEEIPNRRATWFVDPPYEKAGHRYRHWKIDYSSLGKWCRERDGQVIVCEQEPARWLPFKHFVVPRKVHNASNKEYKELIWHKQI